MVVVTFSAGLFKVGDEGEGHLCRELWICRNLKRALVGKGCKRLFEEF